MGGPMAPSHLTLKGQIQDHLYFKPLYLVKEPYVTIINRKLYMASLMAPIDLTLSDLESQSRGHSDRRVVFCKYIFPSSI